jgi:hypothetical protein
MPNRRSWQDSFDRLELARRDEGVPDDSDALQLRAVDMNKASAEPADSKACAAATHKLSAPGFMLIGDWAFCHEDAVKPGQAGTPKRRAKSASPKVPPRKRDEPPRAAKVAQTKAASAKVSKPRNRKPRASAPDLKLAYVAPAPIIVRLNTPPEPPAEMLGNSPLPRNVSLAPYNKPGLFGLIGSWLRLAARRAPLPRRLRKPDGKIAKPRNVLDTHKLDELRAENQELRRQLETLLANKEAVTPQGLTTPAGVSPARPRRRGKTRS